MGGEWNSERKKRRGLVGGAQPNHRCQSVSPSKPGPLPLNGWRLMKNMERESLSVILEHQSNQLESVF